MGHEAEKAAEVEKIKQHRSSTLQSTDPEADALWKPSASLPCSCRAIWHRWAEELPAPAASSRGHGTRPLLLPSWQKACKCMCDVARELLMDASKITVSPQTFTSLKKGSKFIGTSLCPPKAWAPQPLKGNLVQKGCFLVTGLGRATVIKPLNEQIRCLFTKSAPLIALFDQFQNPFW